MSSYFPETMAKLWARKIHEVIGKLVDAKH